ncbi:CDP-alcohol phosphatidyltransferase family protein [Litoribrevibacter euphylliae]|uniref:CDP-alcohol phosphatidyltransferase family protein n=1 Tax=Litoribrevibacter euphylliae TaxID=1834034 RepID=A0ABV7HDQ2_9GAMM
MTEQHFLYRNAANIVSVLGVLPLCLLFMDGGFQYLIPLIIYNNIMDDLDGILAAKMNIRSQFGAHLDNVCDAVAHGMIALAVGVHFGGAVLVMSLLAAGAAILRSTARLDPASKIQGSPTNELMRHLLFVLLLSSLFSFEAEVWLILVFLCHSVTMVSSRAIPGMIRSRANTATKVVWVNLALVVAWLFSWLTLPIALAFILTYGYGVYRGFYEKKDDAVNA